MYLFILLKMIFYDGDCLDYLSSFLYNYENILLSMTNKIINKYLELKIIEIRNKKKIIENILKSDIISYLGGIKYILDIENLNNINFHDISIYNTNRICLSLSNDKPFLTFKLANYYNLKETYLIVIFRTNYQNWSLININNQDEKILKNKPFNNFGNLISNGYHYNYSIKKNIQILIKNSSIPIKINDQNNRLLELILI